MRWLLPLLIATGAQADIPRGDFDQCIASEMARFERSLPRSSPEAPDIHPAQHAGASAFCGGAGIQHCDFQEDRIGCQDALTARQDAMTAAVLGSLPQTVDVPPSHWSENLYPLLQALAHGSSAGDDCAGNGDFDGGLVRSGRSQPTARHRHPDMAVGAVA